MLLLATISNSMGYLDAQAGDAERTAFRRAEKRYKFYKHSSTSARSAKHRDSVPPTDLSEVLDFRRMRSLGVTSENGITRVNMGLHWPVFIIEKHPGFYFIPEALDMEEQMHWIKESLTNFPQPPNRTNHTAFYGPIYDLWNRAQNGEEFEQIRERNGIHDTSIMPGQKADCILSTSTSRTFTESVHLDDMSIRPKSDADQVSHRSNSEGRRPLSEQHLGNNSSVLARTMPMKSLLCKLRWATLGLQFDWSKRAYDLSLPYRKIPQELSELASTLAKPAMNGAHFLAEAAIVNYFGYDDMLGGHLDDMEADWSKPIVSISFGCKAIFLLGGTSREENPTAMFLRSGDVVLMAGPARGCFHGVPRIFVNPEDSDVPKFDTSDPSCVPFIDYIRTSRINLNIRQVF